MADDTGDDEVFPGYRFDPAAAERAQRAQTAFRRALLAIAPASLFDSEPQLIELALSRLADDRT